MRAAASIAAVVAAATLAACAQRAASAPTPDASVDDTPPMTCVYSDTGLHRLKVVTASGARDGEVHGIVRGTDDVLIRAASVIALQPVGHPGAILRARADSSGRFTLPNVPPGRYELRIVSIGYQTSRDTIAVPPSGLSLDLTQVIMRFMDEEALCGYLAAIDSEPALGLARAHTTSSTHILPAGGTVQTTLTVRPNADGAVFDVLFRNVGHTPVGVTRLCYPSIIGDPVRRLPAAVGPACYGIGMTLAPDDTVGLRQTVQLRGPPGTYTFRVHALDPPILDAVVPLTLSRATTPRAPRPARTSQPPSQTSPPPPPRSPSLSAAVQTVDSMIDAAVRSGAIPGAELVIAVRGQVVQDRAFGYAQRNDFDGRRLAAPRPMHQTTLFDLASVTKMMATTNAIMLLVDRGRIDVDAPVYTYLPDFRGPHLDSITVRHLLTHTAGLVQWQPLYYHASTTAQTYDVIRRMPLQWGVGEGYHYSDLGFMLAGDIVARVAGEPLDVFIRKNLYEPLGLTHTTFNPRARGFTDFAATEAGNGYEKHMVYDPHFGYTYAGDPTAWNGWRQSVDDGEVNDGNAFYANGGVAGHAGLFSTGADLRVLLDLLVDRGRSGGRQYLSAAVVDRFLAPNAHLGWMQPKDAPATSFSHTGFTGTYVLGVPDAGLSLVLLTNRQNAGTDAQGNFVNLAPLQSAVTRTLLAALRPDSAAAPRRP